MKQKNYQRWSRPLLLTLLSIFMAFSGANSAWADTLSEGFESVSPAGVPYYGTYPELSNGWKVIGGYISSSSGSTNYGLWNTAHEGSKSLEASYSSSNSASVVITTKLSGTFTFWARKTPTSSTAGYLKLYKANEDGGVYSVTANEIPTTVSTLTTTWTQYSADLGDEGVYVAINLIRAAIDDISAAIYEEGTLAKPTAFTNTATTYNSATFSWTAGGSEPAWQLIYGATEDFDKAAATPVEVSENPFTLTGLDDNTTYYAFLRATDGNPTPTDYSAWTSPVVSFTTPEQYPKPTELTASSITASSASLGWTKNGTETAWQIAYKAGADFDPTDGENGATTVAADANPYSLTGLSETTTYYAYVRAKIDEVTFSRWSSVVSFTTPEAYPTPADFAQTAFTSTTATMSWTANGGESKWNIKYSTDENFDPASAGTLVAVTTNPYTLEGLTDGTTYYAYVQADYGSGHTSNWSNKITLTPTSTLNLLVNDGSNTNSYIPFYGYYADQSANSQFIIPASELTGMTNRQITKITVHSLTASANLGAAKFEVYLKNESNSTFADNTIDWTGMTKVYNSGSVSVSDNKMEITLSTPFIYTTGNLMVGFKQTTSGSCPSISWYGTNTDNNCARYLYGNYGSKDFVQFLPKMTITSDELPAVITPTALTTNSISAFTATLGWTENGDATAWQIALGTTSEFDPAGVSPIEADANPFTLTSLNAETTYYAYVRAKKGGDTSDWSNKVEFTTTTSKPTDVIVAASDNSAKFSWTANAGETAWQIKYSTESEFDPASEGTLQAVSTNPYTLTGLVPETTYYAYLRADLGGGEYSDWTSKQTFETGFEHELTVNNGDATTESAPFNGWNADGTAENGNSQFIIPASQLAGMNGGIIKKLTFYMNNSSATSWSSSTNPTFKVFLKEVDYTEFASATLSWEGLTEVYDGEISIANKQITVAFDSPFEYMGGNLLIGFKETAAGGYGRIYWYGVNTGTNTAINGSNVQFLPKTTFNYETLTGPRLAVSTDALGFGELNQSSTAEDKQKTFTISNTGVAELTGLSVAVSGTGYSVSALPRTNITTEGATADPIELTVTLAPTTSGSYDGTITVSAAGQPNKVINLTATYVADPILGVFNDVDATDAATTGETINFGYVEEAPVYTYYIKNTGAGTLDVAVTDGGLAVSPANASLAAGAQQAFTITTLANTDATVTFTGTNHDGGAAIGTFTVTLQGTVMSETGKFFEGFNHTNGTATTSELVGWEINNTDTPEISFYNSYLYYWASGSESSNVVTPKLRVSGTSDVLRISAYLRNKDYNNTLLSISYSVDKTNWTEVLNKGKNDLELDAQDFTVDGIPEGSYFFKIEMSDVAVGYFYGFSTTLPDAIAVSESVDNNAITTGVLDVNVTYTKAAEKWGTIALPFATTTEELGTIYGTTVNAYQMKSYDGSNLVFENTTTLKAGKPYVIYAPDEMSGTKTFYNKNITATTAGSDEKGTESTVTFQATYAPIAAPNMEGKYGITPSGKVQIGGPNATLKALRGYLTTSAGAHLNIIIDDETTGIKTLLRADDFENGDIYNLKGQKVEKVHKGLYIVNGRKVVVK